MTTKNGRLNPAILVISNTAFEDTATDQVGDILRQTLISEGGGEWGEPLVEIVPDDAERIELAIRKWTDTGVTAIDLIVTTGGTGFAVQDMTPEVGCRRWIDSEHSGILSTACMAHTGNRSSAPSSIVQLLAWCEYMVKSPRHHAERSLSGTLCWQPLSRSHHVSSLDIP